MKHATAWVLASAVTSFMFQASALAQRWPAQRLPAQRAATLSRPAGSVVSPALREGIRRARYACLRQRNAAACRQLKVLHAQRRAVLRAARGFRAPSLRR